MQDQDSVDREEESVRQQIRKLPEPLRLKYYQRADKKLRDPDTYATLNWLFIAGLHHFYLGRWQRGLINISVFTAGVILMLASAVISGAIVILAITLVELYALFFSQRIVQIHNNQVAREILDDLSEHTQEK